MKGKSWWFRIQYTINYMPLAWSAKEKRLNSICIRFSFENFSIFTTISNDLLMEITKYVVWFNRVCDRQSSSSLFTQNIFHRSAFGAIPNKCDVTCVCVFYYLQEFRVDLHFDWRAILDEWMYVYRDIFIERKRPVVEDNKNEPNTCLWLLFWFDCIVFGFFLSGENVCFGRNWNVFHLLFIRLFF